MRSLPGRSFVSAIIAIAMMLGFSPYNGASAKKPSAKYIAYEGKLQDGAGKALGGVYSLTFALYKGKNRSRSMWQETHHVAINGGRYSLELGKNTPLPRKLKPDKAYLGISIAGGVEILREKLNEDSIQQKVKEPKAPPAPEMNRRGGDKPPGKHKGRTIVDYAETAGLSYEADHAKVADKLGGLTEKKIQKKLEAATSKNKFKLGSTKRFSALAGGEGGVQYEVKCPKNFVVVGIRGGSGLYIDSVQLICSPIE